MNRLASGRPPLKSAGFMILALFLVVLLPAPLVVVGVVLMGWGVVTALFMLGMRGQILDAYRSTPNVRLMSVIIQGFLLAILLGWFAFSIWVIARGL